MGRRGGFEGSLLAARLLTEARKAAARAAENTTHRSRRLFCRVGGGPLPRCRGAAVSAAAAARRCDYFVDMLTRLALL